MYPSEEECDLADAIRDEEKDERVQREYADAQRPVKAATLLDELWAYPGECETCDNLRTEGSTYHPPHVSRGTCLVGRPLHCSCPKCF